MQCYCPLWLYHSRSINSSNGKAKYHCQNRYNMKLLPHINLPVHSGHLQSLCFTQPCHLRIDKWKLKKKQSWLLGQVYILRFKHFYLEIFDVCCLIWWKGAYIYKNKYSNWIPFVLEIRGVELYPHSIRYCTCCSHS